VAREGVPLDVIQRQLGHANLGITSVHRKASTTVRSSKRSEAARRRRCQRAPACADGLRA
jgi:integrase